MHPQIDIHLADVLFNSGWHSASSAQWWFETFDEASTCSRVPNEKGFIQHADARRIKPFSLDFPA